MPHLISHILFEVLLARNVQANATLAERLGFDLVGRIGDGGNHNIGNCQAFFKCELGRVCDVMSVEPVLSGDARAGPFGVFLSRPRLRFGFPQQAEKVHSPGWSRYPQRTHEHHRSPTMQQGVVRPPPTYNGVVGTDHFHIVSNRAPVDNGNDPSISSIAVRQDSVVDPRVLEAFHDRERRAWKDRFDRPWWGLIVDGHRDLLR